MRNKIQKTGLIKQMVNNLFDLFNIEQADLIEILYLWDNIKTLQKLNIQYKERLKMICIIVKQSDTKIKKLLGLYCQRLLPNVYVCSVSARIRSLI